MGDDLLLFTQIVYIDNKHSIKLHVTQKVEICSHNLARNFKQGINCIHNLELNQKCSTKTNNLGFQFSFIFFILTLALKSYHYPFILLKHGNI